MTEQEQPGLFRALMAAMDLDRGAHTVGMNSARLSKRAQSDPLNGWPRRGPVVPSAAPVDM